ncbi:hypothetical protein OIE67_43405 [Nonomuraea fuscirosea]|uniref:hypothetical protein n=1 Tax=Nonomuraea fuscirosea TaxID=1291556 RepID=UPI002DD99436|nr:hypothetical protein [Nonomuraea fuscirosea]WSA50844.1 hypothetical protein OIE67_43405 [Nonomuraea fuscirosea]
MSVQSATLAAVRRSVGGFCPYEASGATAMPRAARRARTAPRPHAQRGGAGAGRTAARRAAA